MANETRKITRFESLVDKLVLVLCICMTVFHIYTARFGVHRGMRQSVLHLLFVMVIGYCGYVRNAKNAFQRIFALVMLLAAAVSLGYNYIDNDRIMDRIAQVTKVTKLEMILGIILIVAALDLARRCGIRPDLIVGDFDSLQGALPADVECVRLPVMKDDTETMAAVKRALERG